MKLLAAPLGTCLIFCFFIYFQGMAQRGIGIDFPKKSSALEIKSQSRGLLIPRVELQTISQFSPPITGEKVNSLLVFNTRRSVTDSLQRGYYYFSMADTRWHRLVTDKDTLAHGPWQIQTTTKKANSNTDNIYQTGSVAIGKSQVNGDTERQAMLDVSGAIRGGDLADTAPIGKNSIAVGQNLKASGKNTTVFGQNNKVSGDYASGLGKENKATGYGSTALGRNTSAYGNYALTAGRYTRAGVYETALGRYNAITNGNTEKWDGEDPLFQIGNGQSYSGRQNALTVLKNGKVGLGISGNEAGAKPEKMLDIGSGKLQIRDLPTTPGNLEEDSIVVTNSEGVLKTVRPKAIPPTGPWYLQNSDPPEPATENDQAVYQQGAVAIGKNEAVEHGNTQAMLDIAGPLRVGYQGKTYEIGENSLAMGYKSKAAGQGAFAGGGSTEANGAGHTGGRALGKSSFAFGENTKASGPYAFALGKQNLASGTRATAFGQDTKAASYNSVAFGHSTESTGNTALATGHTTKADGNYSSTFGRNTTAGSAYESVFGYYNALTDGQSTTAWNSDDPLFQIGNGEAGQRHNALTVLKDGWVGIGHHQKKEDEALRIDGYIRADSLIASSETFPDYIFSRYFKKNKSQSISPLQSLEELETYLKTHHHLPGILPKSALSQTPDGGYEINVSRLSVQSLEKIEELFLYIIEQNKRLDQLSEQMHDYKQQLQHLAQKNDDLQKQVRQLKTSVDQLQAQNH